MSLRMGIFVMLALAMALLAPVTVAQKPPAPAPPPQSSPPPSSPTTPYPSTSDPSEHRDDLVMFLVGRIATNDGTAIPNDMLVERVCHGGVRQQVYAAPNGAFSMQLGSMADSFLDASGDRTSQDGVTQKNSLMGIPRRELRNCELRASSSGFRSGVISLVEELTGSDSNIDVGTIVVQRATKIEGMTLSATPYKAPKDATRAYEKGLEAESNGKLANARKYFETAVRIYPNYASAWYQLGTVLWKQNDNEAARKAFTRATTINTSFLPPYLSLAIMAYETENWTEVLNFTDHILDLDPLHLNHAEVTGYMVDLDPLNYAEAYFYNAVANYRLNKIEDAERSGLAAEHVDLLSHFVPQLHLLMAKIFARKSNYASAISEMQTYLELVPYDKDADRLREQLAKLEKLNGSVSTGEKPDPE
jgi:hypothetical protein